MRCLLPPKVSHVSRATHLPSTLAPSPPLLASPPANTPAPTLLAHGGRMLHCAQRERWNDARPGRWQGDPSFAYQRTKLGDVVDRFIVRSSRCTKANQPCSVLQDMKAVREGSTGIMKRVILNMHSSFLLFRPLCIRKDAVEKNAVMVLSFIHTPFLMIEAGTIGAGRADASASRTVCHPHTRCGQMRGMPRVL